MQLHLVRNRQQIGLECTLRLNVFLQIHQRVLPHETKGEDYTVADRGNLCLQSPIPTPIVALVSNHGECTAIRDAEKPREAKTDARAKYTTRVAKVRTKSPQSVTRIEVIASMGGLVALNRWSILEDDPSVSMG